MTDLNAVRRAFSHAGLDDWAAQLPQQLQARPIHGDQARWNAAIADLPQCHTDRLDIHRGAIRIGTRHDITETQRHQLQHTLQTFHPWRKGPYHLYGIMLDTEWRSDWKWDRLATHIAPLAGRKVLDVGCGNGYYSWRMAQAGADWVLGIDPTQLYQAQHEAIRRLLPDTPAGDEWRERVTQLPLGVEQVPDRLQAFNTVFSMGVLYHRRSPIDHLLALREMLRPGGELVLETLILPDDSPQVLTPPGRYAKMRNIWFIPSLTLLTTWLQRCGYQNIQVLNVTQTTPEEQRHTDWMQFESLADFVHPDDPNRTQEGHPAPTRAIVLASP
ncbi:MAG: tRNA 5-methoxyuridine(34)/uridine 5-oxyacetic acid(34) synthase CmoB [Pseudomonadota bacterium]